MFMEKWEKEVFFRLQILQPWKGAFWENLISEKNEPASIFSETKLLREKSTNWHELVFWCPPKSGKYSTADSVVDTT